MKNFLSHSREFDAEAYCVGMWYAQIPIFEKDHPSSYEVGFIEGQNEKLRSQEAVMLETEENEKT